MQVVSGLHTPQGGIFALGTASHAYLEFDAAAGRKGRELVAAVSSLREPRTTMGGVNLVAGFRPELWRGAAPDDAPAALAGFNDDLVGVDDFVMPATQHDAVLWLSGSAYDVIFDVARAAIAELSGLASLVAETSSWPYRHDLDLTGFIDGTENPTLIDAPELVLVPDGKSGAGGTILLLQKWVHEAAAWESLPPYEPGGRDRASEGGQRRARGQAAGLSRREHRSGSLRKDLPAEHAVRHRQRPRHDVRRLQRRAAAVGRDAGEHGRAVKRRARRAHTFHEAGLRCVLLRPLDGVAAPPGLILSDGRY